MLLSAVILTLQETIEAALLISVLLAISTQQNVSLRWLAYALVTGVIGACLYAYNIGPISEWFDYVGQEVVNALIHLLIAVFIVSFIGALYKIQLPRHSVKTNKRFIRLFLFCAICSVALAMIREGTEILMYLSGFFQQNDDLQTVITGSSIGIGIGISIGILLFYGVMNFPQRWRLPVAIFLLALFTGNMLSQSILQLTQADWISHAQPLWDTSDWLTEYSITGQLLYALMGYEATPSAAQVTGYLTGIVMVLAIAVYGRCHVHSAHNQCIQDEKNDKQ